MRNCIEQIIALATPHLCAGCGVVGKIVCASCTESFEYPDRCFSCKRPSLGGLTCSKCTRKTPISLNCPATDHSGVGKALVYAAKYGSKREAADAMAEVLSTRLPYLSGEVVVVPVPTTSSRVRLRGYDQSVRMAQYLAGRRTYACKQVLTRVTKHHQVGAGRSDRIAHMQGAFLPKKQIDLRSVTAILVDDVVTTGATIESAARVLRSLGAKNIIAAYFARAQ